MSSPGFQFKQFYVAHAKCAMKVGTDGTLLGAVASPHQAPIPPFGHPSPITSPHGLKSEGTPIDEEGKITSAQSLRVLDIGTGSGLVALMLAQRFAEAEIDAIDIDEGAVEQATENFVASPWSNRLHAYLSRLQDFPHLPPSPSGEGSGVRLYDLIVSNPPYFQNSLKNPNKGRELARHTDTLSYEELVVHSRRLLREGGCLCVILPAEAEPEMLRLAAMNDFHPQKILYVHPKPEKPAKRVILQLVSNPRSTHERPTANPRENHETPLTEKQTIYIESAHSPRSEEYAELTKEFYL